MNETAAEERVGVDMSEKEEKDIRLSEIVNEIRDHAIKANEKVIYDSVRRSWNIGFKAGYFACERDEKKVRSTQDYVDGLWAAWDAIRKILLPIDLGGMPSELITALFGRGQVWELMLRLSPKEFVDKVKEWENGDIRSNAYSIDSFEGVEWRGKNGVVVRTSINEDGKTTDYTILLGDGTVVTGVPRHELTHGRKVPLYNVFRLLNMSDDEYEREMEKEYDDEYEREMEKEYDDD